MSTRSSPRWTSPPSPTGSSRPTPAGCDAASSSPPGWSTSPGSSSSTSRPSASTRRGGPGSGSTSTTSRESQGVTIFLTTHYLDEADQLCDRIAIIDNGRIIAAGTPLELKDRMGGDTVEVVATSGARDVTDLLRDLPGVRELTRSGDQYRMKCLRGESLVPKVVLACDHAGVELAGVTTRKPSLDEVFLTLTGRAYREEGDARAEPNGSGADAGAAAAGGA